MEAVLTTFRALVIVMIIFKKGESKDLLPVNCPKCLKTCAVDNCYGTHAFDPAEHNHNKGCQEMCFCTSDSNGLLNHTVCNADMERLCEAYGDDKKRWKQCSNCLGDDNGFRADVCRVDCNRNKNNRCNCFGDETPNCSRIRICNTTSTTKQTTGGTDSVSNLTCKAPATTAARIVTTPETQTTTAVESNTTAPDDERVNYTLEYTVNETFHVSLTDPDSVMYENWSINVIESLQVFCPCTPIGVEFKEGSIIVVVILEFDSNFTSQDIISIINVAQENGELLDGHDTSSVALVLPNGGRRTTDYYDVGNMCASIDDEIDLAPTRGDSGGTIAIPIRMLHLQRSNTDVCSCIFEVANDGVPINRLRANFSIDSPFNEVTEKDFVQFQAGANCEECQTYSPRTQISTWLQDDVSYFSVKINNQSFDVNSILHINVLFGETTLWMSCGKSDLTKNICVSEDCKKMKKDEDDSKSNFALVITTVTIVVVVGMLVVLVVAILVRWKRTKPTRNADRDGDATEAYFKGSKLESKPGMKSEEPEDLYQYIQDKDVRSSRALKNAKKKKVPTATLR